MMDIPLPGEPEPVSLIPTPDSPRTPKPALKNSNDFSRSSSQSSKAESFFYSDIPMPDEKPESHDRFSRYSPSSSCLEEDPLQGCSPTTNHTNRILVLGKVQAKKRLLAFSATKQAGGAGLTFNLPKKNVMKPNLAKGFEQLTEDGDVTLDVPLVKKKVAGKKGAPKEDKAKAVVSAIEEIKREELLMRGAFRMAAQSGGASDAASGSSLHRQLDRKKEGDVYSLVDDLLSRDKNKDKDRDRDRDKEKEKKTRSKKHRSSSDKKPERHTHDHDKDKEKVKDKEGKSKEKTNTKSEISKLPVSWAEFHDQKMTFDQIRRAKRELLKKKSSRHSSRSKDAQVPAEQFEKELCNPFDFPARLREPFKAIGARQREKLYSQDAIHYTKSSPTISYSANPDIPSSKYRNRSEIFSFAKSDSVSIMRSVIETEPKDHLPRLTDSEGSSSEQRSWYNPLELFMKPYDAEKSEKCNPSPSTVTELRPSLSPKISERKLRDDEMKVSESDSDLANSDCAPMKWDSELEDDAADLDAAKSESLTTSTDPDSSMLVHTDPSLIATIDNVSPVKDAHAEDKDEVRSCVNGLPDVNADCPEQSSLQVAAGAGSDPYLVNEYEEFMKSVCVNSEDASLGQSHDKHPQTGSEITAEDKKKRKRQRVNSQEKSKSFAKKEMSSKKCSITRNEKSKKRAKVSKRVKKDSITSSPASSDDEDEDEDEDEKPRVKRRKIKMKKNKLKSWKKNKKRKRQVSSSSSDEISSSSVSSDSSESDSSVENSSTSEERISKKRSKKAKKKKKKKMVKKSKQKKAKSAKKRKKESAPEKTSKATVAAFNSAMNEVNQPRLKDSVKENIVEDKNLGKDCSSEDWVDLEDADKDPVAGNFPATALDSNKQGLTVSTVTCEADDLKKFGHSATVQLVQCEPAPKDQLIATAILESPAPSDSNVDSNSRAITKKRTLPKEIKEVVGMEISQRMDIEQYMETDQKLVKGNEKYEIDSVVDGDSLETPYVNDVSRRVASDHDCTKDGKSKFTRLDVITAEAWENDSQEKLDNESKRLKFGGDSWDESYAVNWFNKSTSEERVKSPTDLTPVVHSDIQNTSSLSDDLHQEVGKRSLRELKYLRDVIKNEVVDEGATLESPPVKPTSLADTNFIEKISLAKTTMVTSFVKDFSVRMDLLPVAHPTVENVPSVSDLYSPGQEDDKSTRSNSPELPHDSYQITPEESKSDMSLDSPDSSDDSESNAPSTLSKAPKRHSELMMNQYISLGNIPLPPKCDLEAIEVPKEPAHGSLLKCDLQAIQVPEEPAPCFPPNCDLLAIEVPKEPAPYVPSSESASATVIGKSRTKETPESSSLAKTKHVITVKLLPSELRFKNVETKPAEVISSALNEIMPRNDGKTVWKAIGLPNETAVPIKPIVKKPSRWNSVPCDSLVSENVAAAEMSSMKISPCNDSETIHTELSKDATEVEAPCAAIGSQADELTVSNDSSAVVNEVSSSIIGSGLDTNLKSTKEQVQTHSSDDLDLHKNIVPPEIEEELKQAKVKEHSDRSDKEKDLSKKTDTRERDSSRRQGSRSHGDSKKLESRERDAKRREERPKEDTRKAGRGDSRSRDRHKPDSRRDRRDVKRSRDDRRRSPERNDSRHAEKQRTHGRDDEARSPGARRSLERLDRRRRSRSRENSRSHRRGSRKQSPNHDRVRGSENKDDSRSSSHKSSKDGDKRRSDRSTYNSNGDSLVNIPLPDLQHHGRDDCCSMDMECCSPVSTFSPLVGLKRSVADSTTISDEELKLANCEQKLSTEDFSKQCYSYESPLPSSDLRDAGKGNAPAVDESEFSPKRLSLDERLELELGLRMSPRQLQEQAAPPDVAQYPCYWPNQPASAPPDALVRPSLHAITAGPHANQFVGVPNNFYGQSQQQRLHNFMGAMNSPLMPTNTENNYPPNVRWDHVQTYPGMSALPERPPVQPVQQVVVPEKQFIASMPIESYINGPPLPAELVNRPLPGARPLSPRILPASIPKVVLIPPLMAPMAVHAQAVQALAPTQDFICQPTSIAESEVHMVHKFYPEEAIYADIPSDTEADEKIIDMLSKVKKRSLERKAAHKEKEIIRKREILQARELKKKKLAKYKKAILHEGDTLRRSVSLDLEEMRLNTGMQLSPRPGTSSSVIQAFSPVGSFAPLPPASKGILISIGFGVGSEVPLKERRKSVMFADGVRPGEGTSPSAGEDPLSPTLYVPKEKKLRKKKKKIKVHVIRQVASEESGSGSDSEVPPPPPPPGSPPPELKPYSFPGPSPGKMFLRLSKRMALGGSRVPRVVLVDQAMPAPAPAPAPAPTPALPEAFERTCSDEKTLKLIAYHQAMIAIKGQVPVWSAIAPCQPIGTVIETKPQLPHTANIVMKAITTGPADLFDQGIGNGCLSYPSSADAMGNCAAGAPPHGMFSDSKVAAAGERVADVSPILPMGFGFPVTPRVQPPLPHSPQLRNPPPPPPPLPVSKTVGSAGNPKV